MTSIGTVLPIATNSIAEITKNTANASLNNIANVAKNSIEVQHSFAGLPGIVFAEKAFVYATASMVFSAFLGVTTCILIALIKHCFLQYKNTLLKVKTMEQENKTSEEEIIKTKNKIQDENIKANKNAVTHAEERLKKIEGFLEGAQVEKKN